MGVIFSIRASLISDTRVVAAMVPSFPIQQGQIDAVLFQGSLMLCMLLEFGSRFLDLDSETCLLVSFELLSVLLGWGGLVLPLQIRWQR